jgi:N-acetylmuramoyl-L-alanine amidase
MHVKKTDIKTITQTTLHTLPDEINKLHPDFCISLHCNGSNTPTATGTEVLYYCKSQVGKQIASILLTHLVAALGLPNRGIKPMTIGDRGYYLLSNVDACVIAEPFFITCDRDALIAVSNLKSLAKAYAAAIDEIATSLFSKQEAS